MQLLLHELICVGGLILPLLGAFRINLENASSNVRSISHTIVFSSVFFCNTTQEGESETVVTWRKLQQFNSLAVGILCFCVCCVICVFKYTLFYKFIFVLIIRFTIRLVHVK